MGCKRMLAILAIVVVALPSLAIGTEHIVGDFSGWTLGFNYSAWAEGKEFKVGDTLVFKYGVGKHNVFKVSGSAFEHCTVPPENEAMATGNDVITLATPGKKWYICGKGEGKHCWSGMRLAIDVLPPPTAEYAPVAAPRNSPTWEAPAPAPVAGPRKIFVGDDKGWTLNFDYIAWAHGKEFRVGDILVFKYPVGVHNVFKVNGTAFQYCNVPSEYEALTTGNDEITLATPGKKWYICGKAYGEHCQNGQRLAINVLPAEDSAFPPTPATWEAPAPIAPTVSPSAPPEFKTPAPAPSSSSPVGPTRHIVGGEKGWTLYFNYTAWAEGKKFQVGDSLVFKYHVGVHNVFRVDGPSFLACHVPPENEALTTGYDVITLATPGKKWYICGKAHGGHCQMGQKLVINVLPSASSPYPSDAPSNSPAWKAPTSSPSALPAPSDVPSGSPAWKAPTPSPSPVPGSKKFIVGDYYGWTLNFNYTAWAQGKQFRVGDKLVFKYTMGKHNVFKVDGPAFQQCIVPPEEEAMTTGYDVITLASPGKKWYICGKAHGGHCKSGQKLVINVLPATGQAPSQSPPSGYAPSPSHEYRRRLF